jgi:hypothetical protein
MLKNHDEHGNMVDDEAIQTFISTLDSLPKDEWRARTLAFETLIGSIPPAPSSSHALSSSLAGSSHRIAGGNGGIMPWYSSFTAMRRLANPISSLLLNPRSSVVKHTTQHLAYLVQRVRDVNPPKSDMCKYLLKDLLGPVLAMHGQTVNVIRIYALEMMTIIIPLCRFKSGLPVLLERLRKDKSRDVREACVKYLRLIVRYWSDSGDDDFSSTEEQAYLTTNICTHIGNGLARALMDPAQTVRSEARTAFELFRYHYPDLWNEIVQKPNGVFGKDARLKKSLMNSAMRADSEGGGGNPYGGGGDASVDYVPSSYDDGEDCEIKTLGSGGSRNSLNSWNSNSSFLSKSSAGRPGYRATMRKNQNRSKVVASRPAAQAVRSSSTHATAIPTASTNNNGNNGSLPPASKRIPTMGNNTVPVVSGKTTTPVATTATATGTTKSPARMTQRSTPMYSTINTSTNKAVSEETVTVNSSVTNSVPSHLERKPNENYVISNQLLAAHKQYIDDLMEDLRSEMNTIREFETLLVKSQNHPDEDGTYGPSEDDILKYYEEVYAYLDKGSQNCVKLRNEMERISKS